MHVSEGWLIAIAGMVACAAWWAIRMLVQNGNLKREAADRDLKIKDQRSEIDRLHNQPAVQPLLDQIAELQRERTRLRNQASAAWEQNRKRLSEMELVARAYRRLDQRLKSEQARLAQLGEVRASTEAERERYRHEAVEFSERIQQLERQVDLMRHQDGKLWQRPVPESAPPFRAREERGFPIISVLNLKGGVGKTTLTAHLGGLLAKKGKRVLMVDLDYQRSLSMLLVPHQQRQLWHHERRCVQHFLAGPTHDAQALLHCTQSVADLDGAEIITNSERRTSGDAGDSLEETETRLMAQWAVDPQRGDVRFLLRKALHDPRLIRRFDAVLFDCPPRLTTACVNALAASDFVLVPVIPDPTSARSVGNLVQTLRELHGLLPHLTVLGVVANRVKLRDGGLVQQEHDVWENLKQARQEVGGRVVGYFKTLIPAHSKFGLAAGSIDKRGLRLALADAPVHKCFSQLLTEIEKEIRTYDRSHAAVVSS